MASLDNLSILVIGGTGFIGQHLLQSPELSTCNLFSLSIRPKQFENQSVSYFYGNDINSSCLDSLFSIKFDYIVNLGGYINHSPYFNGGSSVISNHHSFLCDLLNRLDLSSLKRFVQIGSSDEYGLSPSPQHEFQREMPISPYSFAKVANTHFLQMLYRTVDFPAVILRVFLAYGPKQSTARFIPFVIDNCLKDNTFELSPCTQVRDFLYISDLITAIILCLKCDAANGEILNVGSASPVQLYSVVEEIRDIIGRGTPIFGGRISQKIENSSLYPSLSKIQNLLGWNPCVSLTSGLHQTIDSFVSLGRSC